MAQRSVHRAYSRSFNYHSPQTRRKQQNQSGSQNALLQGHRRLEDSASTAGTDLKRSPNSSYGDELTVGPELGRPRSKSQSTPRTVSKSMSPQPRRSANEVFSDQQKQLLRHSWHHVGRHGHSGIGAMIFRRVFDRRPHLRQMFDFGTTPVPRLQYDAIFEIHARNFVNVLDGAIRHLDNFEDDYAPFLVSKGRFHAKFAERGFKTEYWDVFAEAMAESAVEWIGPGKHRETVRAWTFLISCIVDRMRTGYEEELRRRRKANSTTYLQSPDDRHWGGATGGSRSVSPSPPGYSPSAEVPHASVWVQVHEDR